MTYISFICIVADIIEGYDGDSSDSEEGATSFNDTTCLQQSLPNFWLILKVKEDAVDVYYHYRYVYQTYQ